MDANLGCKPEDQDIIGAYHIAMMGNWEEVVAEQALRLSSSGLLGRTKIIICGVAGGRICVNDLPKVLREKTHIECDNDLKRYEYITLERLHRQSMGNRFRAWYVHTKGVSLPRDVGRARWRRLMEYFIIQRHRDCLKALAFCDACGVNLKNNAGTPFFAGNFWWANSDYISRLPPLYKPENRFIAEVWIGMGKGKLVELFNSWDFDNPNLFNRIPRQLENGAYWDGERITPKNKEKEGPSVP